MASLHIAARFTCKSNLPADEVINTWNFLTPTPAFDPDESLAACVAISDFYNTLPPGGTHPVADYLGKQLKRGLDLHEFLVYDVSAQMDGDPHGSPVERRPFTLIAEDASLPEPLPSEMAACLTYHRAYLTAPEFGPNDPVTGNPTRPRASLRGRVYLGPLNGLSLTSDANGVPHLSSVFMTDITLAAKRLRDIATGPQWAVWSRKTSTFTTVDTGWCDNAFDVQRRRGELATVRINIPA